MFSPLEGLRFHARSSCKIPNPSYPTGVCQSTPSPINEQDMQRVIISLQGADGNQEFKLLPLVRQLARIVDEKQAEDQVLSWSD